MADTAETNEPVDPANWSCPPRVVHRETVVLGHGGGGRLTAELLADVAQTFTERQVVILAATIAQVNYWARVIQALGVPPAGFTEACRVPNPRGPRDRLGAYALWFTPGHEA